MSASGDAGEALARRVLHGVRLLGFADDATVAGRCDLEPAAVNEELLDRQALGQVTRSQFAGTAGWSLTAAGRAENERLLAAELAAVEGGRTELADVHHDFVPVNRRLRQACTDWQLRPTADSPLAPNDHTDPAWDDAVLASLAEVARDLAALEARLVAVLPRFAGYRARFVAALRDRRVDDVEGSCHRVWFELHEDLIATLGLTR